MEFLQLKLKDELLKALQYKGYKIPSPVQKECIPPLLEGKDLMGIAQTGTGKTAAFLLPILHRVMTKDMGAVAKAPCVLILAPTRELAAQIGESCKHYAKFTTITHTVIYGGVGQNPQVAALKRGVHILIATPGRLLDLMEQRHVFLNNVEVFVLDEADRMLDMGFIHDVKRIVELIPKQRQTMFFSATMSREVEQLARKLLINPVHVEVTPQATTVEKIKQEVLFVDQEKKDDVLIELLQKEHLNKVLVFTRTKSRANKLAKKLNAETIKADAIHGNKTQNQRMQALGNFQKGRTRILIATDIAARGIDVERISHVINYDLPNEPENYVHRIGRTARAGKEGVAYSFCAADESGYWHDIEKLTRQKIDVMDHRHHSKRAQDATGPLSRTAHKQRQNNAQKNSGSRRFAEKKKPSSRKKFYRSSAGAKQSNKRR